MATLKNVCGALYSNTEYISQALEEGLLVITNIGNQEYYECQVCHKTMSGIIPAQAHLQGSPHLKAIRNYICTSNINARVNKFSIDAADSTSWSKLSSEDQAIPSSEQKASDPSQKSSGSFDTDTLESAMRCGIVTEDVMSSQRYFTCTLCNINCTGEVPMNQHIRGEPHLKQQRRFNFSKRANPVVRPLETDSLSSHSIPSPAVMPAPSTPVQPLPSPSLGDGESSENLVQSAIDDGIVTRVVGGDPSHLTCEICHSSCTGVTPMKQHLQGNSHLKKMRARGLVVRSQQRSIIKPPMNPDDIVKSWTSPSRVQSSSDTSRDVLETAKGNGIVIETGSAFECLICNASCTGVVPVTDHLNGEAHHKKMRDQVEYQQFMLQTPVVRDSTSSCSSSPETDRKSHETSLTSCISRSIPDVVTPCAQLDCNVSDTLNPVSQTDSSPVRNIGLTNITLDNIPETAMGVKIYNPNDPLDNLFD